MDAQINIVSVRELIDALGGTATVSRMIGTGQSAVSEMKRRGTIPVSYWPELLKGAPDHLGIDAEFLMRLHTDGPNEPPPVARIDTAVPPSS